MLRTGFTTGSCATAAAGAATYMLLTGKTKDTIDILTPKGVVFHAKVVDITIKENEVTCAVIKDAGDDPDVTHNAKIFATVTAADDLDSIIIDGGEGVGRVTKPGLDRPVGDAAINTVPRKMIEEQVRNICRLCDYDRGIKVIISVPGGQEIAKKTFNERLGIIGGISIIGTTGIVEPMSEQALIDTIKVELNQKKALGKNIVAISPGNYGLDFMKNTYGFNLDESVKCSNYIGDTLDIACETGFEGVLLCGHIGKFIKLAGGIMNTHSKVADCRMELLSIAALNAGCDKSLVFKILDCVTTEQALSLIDKGEMFDKTMQWCMDRIMYHLRKRAQDRLNIECIVYSNEFGLLCKSAGADRYIEIIKNDKEKM